MTTVAVVGGGPAGLSAALFTQKNGLDTVVFDTDETWMHMAHLFNYLGIRSISGSEFMTIARGQVTDRGTTIHQGEEVTGISETEDGFEVVTEESEYEANYVVLATGRNRQFAKDLGCDFTEEEEVDVSVRMETSVPNVYATGAMVRDQEMEAIISAGDGATAALNILSKEKGEGFHDFDKPDDVPTLASN
ncbi:NAD(P)/FAD-dependent oxidoreductase [Haladaptatus caseinilyticus]|uniref:NAD(P)/FAD-dependent oxidoreductase n=1 Tax=Haladaptatus caseinilyticus TaxID=2993314 RepID=UPI00224B400A|nr:FAD-dependent oxidoreductase [Haladaptatus caseinilyticus]